MRLQLHSILPALKPYIKVICTMECDEDADTSHIRVLPDTCVELFINFSSTPVAIIDKQLHKRSIVTFRMSQPMDVSMRKGAGCLAICFHPGMAYKFFNLPMYLLSNTTTALSELWDNLAIEIEDRVACSPDNESRVETVQHYLLKHLASGEPDLQMAQSLKLIHESKGLVPLKKLSDEIGISQRHLLRKFQQCIGLSPKEYMRVHRFLQFLSYLKKQSNLPLTEVAYKSGYYDQAHFNRDYKTFSGHTPREIVQASDILY
jgi:AraC-like DNA-binding protein